MIQAKLLIVDDDKGFLEVIGIQLAREISSVETLSDARDAERKILDGNYDVVVIDERLAGLSGSEIARRVRAMKPDQRCVIVTGCAHNLEPIPGVPIVAKGATVDRLTATIREVMGTYDGTSRAGLRQAMVAIAGLGVRLAGAAGAACGFNR